LHSRRCVVEVFCFVFFFLVFLVIGQAETGGDFFVGLIVVWQFLAHFGLVEGTVEG